jgi:hypothetical protein
MLTKLTVLTQKRAFSFRELGPSYVIDRPSQMAWWGTPAMSTPADVQPLRASKRRNCCHYAHAIHPPMNVLNLA